MTRCVVKFTDGTYVNLRADSMTEEDNGFIGVYRRGNIAFEVVGKFKLEGVAAIYLSETKDD